MYDGCPTSYMLGTVSADGHLSDTHGRLFWSIYLQRDRRYRDAPGGTRNIQKIYRWDRGQRVSKFRALLPLSQNMEPYILGDFRSMQVLSLIMCIHETVSCTSFGLYLYTMVV